MLVTLQGEKFVRASIFSSCASPAPAPWDYHQLLRVLPLIKNQPGPLGGTVGWASDSCFHLGRDLRVMGSSPPLRSVLSMESA